MTQMHFGLDFAEMLRELSAAGAEFLVVGAHAVGAHVQPRATKDLDIWVHPTPENAKRVWQALIGFGAPLDELTVDDLSVAGTIYQMGYPPNRIDILTSISGVSFDEAWADRVSAEFAGARYPVIGKKALIANKQAVGRHQDLGDLDLLRKFPSKL
jgi:hypothetical protein